MTQREKLVELIKKAYIAYDDFSDKAFSEFLSDNLLENGVIVPPCKVGDTVWIIGIMGATVPEAHKIIRISIRVGSIGQQYCFEAVLCGAKGIADCGFWQDQIGKTVFLTKEEAEEKLKEWNEKDEI